MTVAKKPNLKDALELGIIQFDEVSDHLVNARHLHQWLGVKTKFTEWIQIRIRDYSFLENLDFFRNFGKTPAGGRPLVNYGLTFDMAKELAMLERNTAGRIVRRWFIEKEKELRVAKATFALPPLKDALRGIKSTKFGGRKMYPYREVLRQVGYSHTSGCDRKGRYPMHFLLVGNINYITEEFANHLAHSRAVYANRKVLVTAQGILPLNFGDTSVLLSKGGEA